MHYACYVLRLDFQVRVSWHLKCIHILALEAQEWNHLPCIVSPKDVKAACTYTYSLKVSDLATAAPSRVRTFMANPSLCYEASTASQKHGSEHAVSSVLLMDRHTCVP